MRARPFCDGEPVQLSRPGSVMETQPHFSWPSRTVALAPLTLLTTIALRNGDGSSSEHKCHRLRSRCRPRPATSMADWMVCLAAVPAFLRSFASLSSGTYIEDRSISRRCRSKGEKEEHGRVNFMFIGTLYGGYRPTRMACESTPREINGLFSRSRSGHALRGSFQRYPR